jgi:hypothetical protein
MTVKEEYEYKNNKHYIKYAKEKAKITAKYKGKIYFDSLDTKQKRSHTPYDKKERELYLTYLKEIGDLLLKPDGSFQEFVWDIVAPSTKAIQKIRARGSFTSPYSFNR